MEGDVEIADVLFHTDRQSKLGRGSDAGVYRGTWYGTPVAVKLLHDALVDPENTEEGKAALLRRFVQEGHRLRSLRHPNVVMFLGMTRWRDDRPVIVTELLNCSLLGRYNAAPRLTPLQELHLLRDTASALAYLHAKNIVHCDLKTENVFVTNEGRAKIGDLGSSRSLQECTVQAPGTTLYMSPEALEEGARYGFPLDAFSFGVTLMALVLRREPDGVLLEASRFTTDKDGVVTPVPEVQRRGVDVQAVGGEHPLFAALNRCLENNPDRRPTALEIHSEMNMLVGREMERLSAECRADGVGE